MAAPRNFKLALLVLLLFGVVIILFPYLLGKKKVEDRVPSGIPEASSDSLKPGTEEAERIMLLSKRFQKERTLLLKRNKLDVVDGVATIPLTVKSKRVCFHGDADAIKEDLRRSPSKKMYLTFESLEGKKKIYPTELPRNFLNTGVETKINLPVSETPHQYGVYLCSSSNGGNCGSKPHEDMNDVFVEQLNNPKSESPDRAYFFQYALVDEDGLATFSEFPAGDQAFTGLNEYLVQDRGIDGQVADSTTRHAKEWTHGLNNLPLVTGGGKFGIELPLAAPIEECLGKQ